jgi:hypothetical protein
MKYNPITQQLYTDSGTFLKQLHCPLAKQWEQLDITSNAMSKTCEACNKAIYDTSILTDSELQSMLESSPNACLKVELGQPNMTISYTITQQS